MGFSVLLKSLVKAHLVFELAHMRRLSRLALNCFCSNRGCLDIWDYMVFSFSYAACDAVGAFSSVRVQDHVHGVANEYLNLVELHFSSAVGEDLAAVAEGYSIFEIGEDFGDLALGG